MLTYIIFFTSAPHILSLNFILGIVLRKYFGYFPHTQVITILNYNFKVNNPQMNDCSIFTKGENKTDIFSKVQKLMLNLFRSSGVEAMIIFIITILEA